MNQNHTEKRSIRAKVTITMIIAFLCMFVILYFVYFFSMQTLLVEREADTMVHQAQLSESALMSSVNYLPSVTRDWSSWDDTYGFVQGDYPEFMENALTEYPFQLFRINFITILDENGDVVYEEFYDHETNSFLTDKPVMDALYAEVGPATLSSFDASEELDLTDTTQIGIPGFINQGGEIYYLSSYPVLYSDETGPPAGTFIFGRMIDQMR